MLVLIKCSIIGVGGFFPSEQSSLAMTRYNSFRSSEFKLNQYIFIYIYNKERSEYGIWFIIRLQLTEINKK